MTLSSKLAGALLLMAPLFVMSAQAQGLQAVRPLSGYKCMALNLSEQQMMTETVPMLAQPSAGAPKVGIVAATVIAAESPPVNGYQKVLRLDGKVGWVSSQYLKPWVNPGSSGQKCVPSLMSNGRLGYAYQ